MLKEGSIYEMKQVVNGKKYKRYAYQWVDEYGRRHTKTFPKDNYGLESARNFMRETIEKRARGYKLANEKKTIGQWIIEYLTTYKKPRLKERSFQRQLDSAKKLDPIADIPLDCLLPIDVQQLYNSLKKEGQSSSSISKVHKLLKEAYKRAKSNKLIMEDPMDSVDNVKVETGQIKVFTYRQIRMIFGTIKKLKKGEKLSEHDYNGHHFNTTHDYRFMFWMLLTTGMRIMEVLNLKWEDIDLRKDTIYIEKSKTEAGTRYIPILSSALFNLLQEKQQKTGYVFATKSGSKLQYNNVYKIWIHISNESGIPQQKGRAFHIFRHTFATYILRNMSQEIPMVSLSRILGHADVSITLKIYQHHIPDDNERILKVVRKNQLARRNF